MCPLHTHTPTCMHAYIHTVHPLLQSFKKPLALSQPAPKLPLCSYLSKQCVGDWVLGKWETLALYPCFTISQLSCCIFTTRTAEGRKRRKPVQGCQREPGTSPGCFVFEQEPFLLQPSRLLLPLALQGPQLGEAALLSRSPADWGRGREVLQA